MNAGRPWTAEDLERLHELLAERQLDFAGIAKAMGRSKDSIIGKVHRLKLPSPPSFYNPALRGPRGQWLPAPGRLSQKQALGRHGVESLSPVQRASLGRKPAAPPGDAPPPPAAPAYEPGVAAIPPARVCQYPRGSKPAWDWCGAPVVHGRPYCAAHLAVCVIRRPMREVA